MTLSGLESTSHAVETCENATQHFPARCRPAYVIPYPNPPHGTELTCETSWYYWCEATSESMCGLWGGYSPIVNGICNAEIMEVYQPTCWENYLVKTITQYHCLSECRGSGCVCGCYWLYNSQPPLETPICDCM